MIDRVTLRASDGETLEGRWDRPDSPIGAVVLCHPDPQQGGTMMAPLMVAMTTRLVERGYSVLRFNFRGIGASTGSHDNGNAEVLDVAAAITAATNTGLAVHLSGGLSEGARRCAGSAARTIQSPTPASRHGGGRSRPVISRRGRSESWLVPGIRWSTSMSSGLTPSSIPSTWSSLQATTSSMAVARRSGTWWPKDSSPIQTPSEAAAGRNPRFIASVGVSGANA